MDPPTHSTIGPLVATDDGSFTIEDPVHGETYHSRFGARREARELYVEASGFALRLERSSSPDHEPDVNPNLDHETLVLDVGLGLAYNAIETIRAWRTSTQPFGLRLVSLEQNESLICQITSHNASWTVNWDPELREILKNFRNVCPKKWQATILHPYSKAQLIWEIHQLDASVDPLPYDGEKKWDFIWQDPFSPRINPDMWSDSWFEKLCRNSHGLTRLMTYSVARGVREALSAGGWQWTKIKTGTLLKKNWLMASPLRAH